MISWALYDWANSACATTVMAGFFPAFFKDYWSVGAEATLTTARLGLTNSIGSIVVAVMAPLLGALTDQRGYKKMFCFIFMMISVVGCFFFSIIPQGDWVSAVFCYGIVMLGFTSSGAFYDSLLPAVAPPSRADYVSSLGYGLGYLGGGLLFLFNVILTLKPEMFGLTGVVQAVQISFASVGVWWFVFSIPLFKNVPEPAPTSTDSLWTCTKNSITSFTKTVTKLRHENKNLLLFLIAFWLYIDGVYTVITMAVDFGKSLNLPTSDLMMALLIVQFVGLPFALLFSKLSHVWGCRKPILMAIAVYGVSLVFASNMTQSWHFFALACVIGMVQGGVQALSRSLFSKMIPAQNAGEYFGVFNLIGKFASILGPLIVGMGAYLSGNPRVGMMSLLILFVVGGWLLLKVKEPEIS